jgi:SAM-dependent methyltransferase
MVPKIKDLYPCILDDVTDTPVDATYVYQDAWAFRKIVVDRPKAHLDVGSHHKFVSLMAQVVPTTMVDIRPLGLEIDGLHFQRGSILELPFEDGSVESLSCLCVVEHIGLGRYGDPLDPFGSEKALSELFRVLEPGGNLYLSLPIDDKTKVFYDAHRAFKEDDLLELFESMRVIEKAYIYGSEFVRHRREGFGTGCYHLRALEK